MAKAVAEKAEAMEEATVEEVMEVELEEATVVEVRVVERVAVAKAAAREAARVVAWEEEMAEHSTFVPVRVPGNRRLRSAIVGPLAASLKMQRQNTGKVLKV